MRRINWGNALFSLVIATAIVLISRGEIVGGVVLGVIAGFTEVVILIRTASQKKRDRDDNNR